MRKTALDKDVQKVLAEAYEQGLIRGSKLDYVKTIIERRQKKGKAIYKKKFSPKQLTAQDIQHIPSIILFLGNGFK